MENNKKKNEKSGGFRTPNRVFLITVRQFIFVWPKMWSIGQLVWLYCRLVTGPCYIKAVTGEIKALKDR